MVPLLILHTSRLRPLVMMPMLSPQSPVYDFVKNPLTGITEQRVLVTCRHQRQELQTILLKVHSCSIGCFHVPAGNEKQKCRRGS